MARPDKHRHFAGDPDPDPQDGDGWDLAEGLDPEGPSAADLDRFGGELSTCEHCGAEIYDQAPVCPVCGLNTGEPERTLSLWVVLLTCVCIVLLLLFVF